MAKELKALTRTEDGGNRFRQALRTLRWRWQNIAGSDYDANQRAPVRICRKMTRSDCADRCASALRRAAEKSSRGRERRRWGAHIWRWTPVAANVL